MTDHGAQGPASKGTASASNAAAADLETPAVPLAEMAVASGRKTRKKRSRLSCMECRQKKLACDRNLPCQRCAKSGRAATCAFEAGAGPAPASLGAAVARQQEDIRRLQAEIADLKAVLSGAGATPPGPAQGGGTPAAHNASATRDDERPLWASAGATDSSGTAARHPGGANLANGVAQGDRQGPSHPSTRAPRGYYSRHTLFRFFTEIPDLFPLITETAKEWLQPLGVHIGRSKPTIRPESMTHPSCEQELNLFSLLPSRSVTDELVVFYLDRLEHTHRVVHIPSFKRDYAKFWAEERPRHPAMAALVLAVISVSTSVSAGQPGAAPVAAPHGSMPPLWISACEGWIQQQSPKHRSMAHYQVRCLVYMAKRVNNIGKKWFWKDTGSLVHDAVLDGLHCDPRSTSDSPFAGEMKRRIWCVLRELDLQNSFECGLPTLLQSLESDVDAPSNLDDEGWDDMAEELPRPKPPAEYTAASFQLQSSRSWPLRLEISRRLYAAASAGGQLCYGEVLQYTHKLTEAMGEITAWERQGTTSSSDRSMSLLAHGILQCQLRDCVLALHRPYLQKDPGEFWLSRTISHETSCELLLLHTGLAAQGLHSFTALREDLLLASLTLASIATSPSRDLAPMDPAGTPVSLLPATGFIRDGGSKSDAHATIALLQQCLPLQEERYLRGCNEEPWCFLTLCAALMVVQVHAGQETRQTAKAACARRFLDLHYRRVGVQQSPHVHDRHPKTMAEAASQVYGARVSVPSLVDGLSGTTGTDLQRSDWTPSGSQPLNTDIRDQISFDAFSFDMEGDDSWDFLQPLWSSEDSTQRFSDGH